MMYWKGCGRKQLWPALRYCPSVCLENLRNAIKTLSQDMWLLGPDFNLVPPKYNAGVLATAFGKIVLERSSVSTAEK
jgi:hypothetical protein